MSLLQLDGGEVHLWTTEYEQIDEAMLASYRSLLSEEERQRIPRFYFENDQVRYLVTRALLRITLSRYAPLAPTEWKFEQNDYGRPRIAEQLQQGAAIEFNLSHTKSLIALAVTRGRQLGVDVENVVSRPAPVEIANHFFAAEEANELAKLEPDAQQRRFYEYWTLKESYIKARGMGLSLPLDKFWFTFPCAQSVAMQIDCELADDPQRWNFCQLSASSDYLLSLCIESVGPSAPSLRMMAAIPGSPEIVSSSPDLLRKSHRG